MNSLSERLREAVKNSGVTQAEVAYHCGLSRSIVSRFLADKGSLSLHAAERLSECLRLRLVHEREWNRRDIIWHKYQIGELRRRGEEF